MCAHRRGAARTRSSGCRKGHARARGLLAAHGRLARDLQRARARPGARLACLCRSQRCDASGVRTTRQARCLAIAHPSRWPDMWRRAHSAPRTSWRTKASVAMGARTQPRPACGPSRTRAARRIARPRDAWVVCQACRTLARGRCGRFASQSRAQVSQRGRDGLPRCAGGATCWVAPDFYIATLRVRS